MSRSATKPHKVIIWGATGQAKVVRPILDTEGIELVALFDDTPGLKAPFSDVPLYEGRREFPGWITSRDGSKLGFVIAIGNPHGRVRLELQGYLMSFGLQPVTVIHPTAWVEPSAVIGAGTQIMAGAIIMAEAVIGDQCIVNTRASVDHETVLAAGVEIAPGATLCGLVHCETNAWVCAGATVLPRMRIGADAVVGAGAVVRTDVASETTVVGVPARIIADDPAEIRAPRMLQSSRRCCNAEQGQLNSPLARSPE